MTPSQQRLVKRAAPMVMLVMGSVVLLSGCAEPDLDPLAQTLADIRQSPLGEPPSISVLTPESASLDYLYSDQRSPFLAPQALAESGNQRNDRVPAPNSQRASEPLEQFPLQELQLVGTMTMAGRRVALIASPDGAVTSVRKGDYMGTNNGRIAKIDAQAIHLTEHVLTQREGWQERQVSLVINEDDS
ncbi:pilus assembly protein PilP [Halomonas sp. MC140]|nr:pilus assembly protein PilP [Halomonas sp. MC140]MDN7131008.1 pilus assembly protein PilP [Halomonas sp. MC140]